MFVICVHFLVNDFSL